ncbi:hypothetical protein D9M70_473090 [compost metagenome]
MDLPEEAFDALQGIEKIDRVDRSVAQVADSHQVIGSDAAHVMNFAHQARHVSYFARPMTSTSAVGRAAVPRDANQSELHLARVFKDG